VTSAVANVIQAVGQIITWTLVICGWLVVNRQHNERETRKEIRSRLDSLDKYLRGVEETAIEFHTAGYDVEKARRIVAETNQLWGIANRLNLVHGDRLRLLITRVRQAMTLHNFDESDYQALAMDAEQIAEIGEAVEKLLDALESAYGKRYYS
jgi:hypothetical protein